MVINSPAPFVDFVSVESGHHDPGIIPQVVDI